MTLFHHLRLPQIVAIFPLGLILSCLGSQLKLSSTSVLSQILAFHSRVTEHILCSTLCSFVPGVLTGAGPSGLSLPEFRPPFCPGGVLQAPSGHSVSLCHEFVGVSEKGQTADEVSCPVKHLGQGWVIVSSHFIFSYYQSRRCKGNSFGGGK